MDWFVDCDRTIAALVSRFFHHRDLETSVVTVWDVCCLDGFTCTVGDDTARRLGLGRRQR